MFMCPRGGKYKREEILAFTHPKIIAYIKILILAHFKIQKVSRSWIILLLGICIFISGLFVSQNLKMSSSLAILFLPHG